MFLQTVERITGEISFPRKTERTGEGGGKGKDWEFTILIFQELNKVCHLFTVFKFTFI